MWIFFFLIGCIQGVIGMACIAGGMGEPGLAPAGLLAVLASVLWFGLADLLWTLGRILKTLDATAKYQRERDKNFL